VHGTQRDAWFPRSAWASNSCLAIKCDTRALDSCARIGLQERGQQRWRCHHGISLLQW